MLRQRCSQRCGFIDRSHRAFAGPWKSDGKAGARRYAPDRLERDRAQLSYPARSAERSSGRVNICRDPSASRGHSLLGRS